MRYVRRDSIPSPHVLTGPGQAGPRERQLVEEKYESLQKANKPLSRFAFEFKAYKHAEVKDALNRLFHGKCAYCESRYAGTQPMDVEHWRPKGLVEEDGQIVMQPGYYWLAADWDNLLPSCIDCNRRREQRIAGQDQPVLLGKANRFPLVDGKQRNKSHLSRNMEEPLLINPCTDDPQEHFCFTDDGMVLPKEQSPGKVSQRGGVSIEVYGLNRTELVWDRREITRLIQQRMTVVRRLARLLDADDLSATTHRVVEDLLSHELAALRRFKEPEKPFSLMATQMIDDFFKELMS